MRRLVYNFLFLFFFIFLSACGGSSDPSPPPMVNKAPTIEAIASQSFFEQTVYKITANASDSDGSIATYAWSQLSGESLILTDTDNATLSVRTPDIDEETSGQLQLIVSDNDGATANIIIDFKITHLADPDDTTPPIIVLNGDNPMNITRGSSYDEPGALATDDEDGSVAVEVNGSVDTSITGTYTVSYTASDASGNTSYAERTVQVIPPPSVRSFLASSTTILEGESIDLVAVFSNGKAIIDNEIGSVESGEKVTVSPNSTTTYTITVTNIAGTSSTSTVTVSVAPIILSLLSPSPEQTASDNLTVKVAVRSVLDITAVDAVVGGRSTYLTYSSTAICERSSCNPGFTGQISLSGLASERYLLTVTATDIAGNAVSVQRAIVIDTPPKINVIQPIDHSVARPTIPLNITCVDKESDCEITVKFNSSGNVITSGIDTLNETLDLTSHEGQIVIFHIQGKDSTGKRTSLSKTIYVDSSANLTKVKDFPGPIIDFDGQRALIKEKKKDGDSLTISDIALNTTKTVDVPTGLVILDLKSFLTPTGVIYTTKATDNDVRAKIFDWNNEQLIEIGRANSSSSLDVAGDFAIWSNGSSLWRRQLSTKINTLISTDAGNWRNAIGNNGVVAYWTHVNDYSIVRYQAGTYTTLASDSNYWNTHVVSDGTNFVYRKHDACCSNQQYAITYHDGNTETLLTAFRSRQPYKGRDYQINNGWVAFTELGGIGQTHVWTRAPNGTYIQHTIYGSESYIDMLSSDGEVMLINSRKRYLSDTFGSNVPVNSSLGRSIKVEEVWYIIMGRSLFKYSED